MGEYSEIDLGVQKIDVPVNIPVEQYTKRNGILSSTQVWIPLNNNYLYTVFSWLKLMWNYPKQESGIGVRKMDVLVLIPVRHYPAPH